jgi:AraC family transcriptional regulator, regulatory protein of adaptative response / DNA-3-methyladenine glycosylase II
VELTRTVCDRARLARDARFDGRFFIGVTSTRIYCRPVCPAQPKASNILYFPSAAAAAEAGFRPCLRCRPETSPGTPAWLGTSTSVSRGLKLISEGALDETSVDNLAERLGLGSRHLRRMFLQHLGATPIAVAQTRRVHFAKKLIDETELPMTQVAMAAGFGSIRRFNATFQKLYGRTPGDLRRTTARERGKLNGSQAGVYTFRLGYRPPYNWASMIGFLGPRAIPGVETIALDEYSRTISLDGKTGYISVRPVFQKHYLELRIEFPEPAALFRIVERVRNIFDLRADPARVDGHLRRDARLKSMVQSHAGMRVPGCWDGFEIAVRAILGQQVSVKGATTMAGRLVATFSDARIFPNAEALADADLTRIGLTKQRAHSIRELASAVVRGEVSFDASLGLETFEESMTKLPGIGPWTAQYIAMRIGEPDAFPAGDLYLRNFAKESDAWRPWRAYAAMYIWNGNHNL